MPRPRKLLLYLDQNFISEMAKRAEATPRPDFHELYDILHEAFWGEKLVVLRSSFHDVETSLAGALKKPIRARQSTLGHVDLVGAFEIKESQLVASIHRHLGRPAAAQVICHEDAFEDDPDEQVGHFDVNVDMDWMHSDAKTSRQRLAAALDKVRRRILEQSTSFEEQFAVEMNGARADALEPYNATVYAAAAGVTREQYASFVASDAFAEVPIIKLDVSLLTRVMTAHATRAIKEGDVTDVEAMATYLPYCDVYGADRFMAEVARSLTIPETYGCALFDSGRKSVAGLIEHLRGALDSMEAVNVPDLSIFVTPHDGIKENSFSFFKKIGVQSKMAANRYNTWVEVFGLDDGRMPRYAMRGIPGTEGMPFFGFQDVSTVQCKPTDTREAIIEACRARCRSTHFVLVDAFQELPDNFIMTAIRTPRDGKSRILGYQVISALD